MGHRANLVVIEGGRRRVFYGHWSSKALVCELFFGPEVGLAWILSHREVGDEGWLDDVWAEGGAVVDFDRRELALFGGEDLRYDPFLLRTYLELLTIVWRPWSVRWAERGQTELAEVAGVDPARVASGFVDDVRALTLGDTITVVSVRDERGVAHLGVDAFPNDVLAVGVGLVAWVQAAPSVARLEVPAGTELWAGLWIDVLERTVRIWLAHDLPRLAVYRSAWTPYDIVLLGTRWEDHLERAHGTLSFVVPPVSARVEALRATVMRGVGDGGAAALRAVVAEKEGAGHEVEVAAFATIDPPRGLGPEARARIFDEAVGALR